MSMKILAIASLMMLTLIVPIVNSTSEIQRLGGEEYKCYVFCHLELEGWGDFFWMPLWGTTFGVIGNVSIRALFSFDISTYKLIKINDGCEVNGNYVILTRRFIGTKERIGDDIYANGFCLFCCPATENYGGKV